MNINFANVEKIQSMKTSISLYVVIRKSSKIYPLLHSQGLLTKFSLFCCLDAITIIFQLGDEHACFLISHKLLQCGLVSI